MSTRKLRDTIPAVDIKRLITHFTYHVEQKPGGGFVARATDPKLPPIEAPTRIELQHKIQDNINAALAAEFPDLHLPQDKRISFHIERESDGTLALHSTNPGAPGSKAIGDDEVENHLAEKLFSFFGKQIVSRLPPEIAAQLPADLSAQLNSGSIKVFLQRDGNAHAGTQSAAAAAPDFPASAGELSAPEQLRNSSSAALDYSNSSPITPVSDAKSNIIARLLLAALVVAAILYFYLHFHR